jgi:hypothetical protein
MLNVTIKIFLDFVATAVTLRPPVKPGTLSDQDLSRENYSCYLPVSDWWLRSSITLSPIIVHSFISTSVDFQDRDWAMCRSASVTWAIDVCVKSPRVHSVGYEKSAADPVTGQCPNEASAVGHAATCEFG